MSDVMNDENFCWENHAAQLLASFNQNQREIYDALERRGFAPFLDWEKPFQCSASDEAMAYLTQMFAAPMMFGGIDAPNKHARNYVRSLMAERFPQQEDALPEYSNPTFEVRNRDLAACYMLELNALCGELGLPPYYDIDPENGRDVEGEMLDLAKELQVSILKKLKED